MTPGPRNVRLAAGLGVPRSSNSLKVRRPRSSCRVRERASTSSWRPSSEPSLPPSRKEDGCLQFYLHATSSNPVHSFSTKSGRPVATTRRRRVLSISSAGTRARIPSSPPAKPPFWRETGFNFFVQVIPSAVRLRILQESQDSSRRSL